MRRGVDPGGAQLDHGLAVSAVESVDGSLKDMDQKQGLLSAEGGRCS